MKILMTGSHGFVGTNLIESLIEEHDIIRWDIRENKSLPEVDAVIHLAGLAHDTKNTTLRDEYYKVNTLLTEQLFDQFLDSSAKKFLFFSSAKALDGETPYAESKMLAEEYINSKKDKLKDKNYYILRPCMIHGKGMKGNLPLLINVIKSGLPWPLTLYENYRSYASMENVCFIVSKLLSMKVESGTYNICDDELVSTNELVEIIYHGLGKKPYFLKVPKSLIYWLAKIGDIVHFPLNTEKLNKLTGNFIVSNDKIKKALGVSRMPINAKDGLMSTIDEYVKM